MTNHIRNLLILLVASMACAHDGQETVEPPPFQPTLTEKGVGLIRVDIEAAGDPKLGSDSYFMRLDGKSLAVPVDTGAVIEAFAGRHVIDFGYADDELWCTVLGAGTQVFDVAIGRLTNVAFRIDCPALGGTGTLVLRVEDYTAYCDGGWVCDYEARHGTEQPTLTLERINGTPIKFTTRISMWADVAIPLDAGTYRITAIGIPGCSGDSPPDASVHASKTARRNSTIVCY